MVRSRIDWAMAFAGDEQDEAHHHGGDRDHDRADVADLLGELRRRTPSRSRSWSRRSSSRTSRRPAWRADRRLAGSSTLITYQPTDVASADLGGAQRLVHVVVVEEELRLVDALLGRVVDAVDGEVPRASRPACGRSARSAARGRRPSSRTAWRCRRRRSRRCGWRARPSSDPRAAGTRDTSAASSPARPPCSRRSCSAPGSSRRTSWRG